MSKENACALWDFRVSQDELTYNEIIETLSTVAKHFVFQLEKGDSGYKHFQGRISLIKKRRYAEKHLLLKLFPKWKPNYLEPTTSVEFAGTSFSYVMKIDTRIDGPWTEKDVKKEVYIPRQYKNKLENLYPFQQTIFNSAEHFNDRDINILVCNKGCKGKSTIAHVSRLFGNGLVLPPINDAKELIATCCDMAEAKGVRNPSPIFIDMPRAQSKDKLYGIFAAIEQIKNGYLYDMRYKFHSYDIDSPAIWVFTNTFPDKGLLSMDRWNIWSIGDNNELVPYDEELI